MEVDGELVDRDIDEIAREIAQKALNEWGKSDGELLYAQRAPQPLYDKWKKNGVLPRNIAREIVEIMHRTHIGVDQDYKNLVKQGTRAAIADGWSGSMLATDLQDALFGTPTPVQSEANLGVMKADHVNLVIHGHEPILSEMIVAVNDNIINGRIRGIAGVVGCNNARTRHNEGHIQVVKELIKNDVIVLTTGCNGIACAMEGLLTPESAAVFCGPGLTEVCETVGIPPVLHMGSCVDNSRILLAATEVVKAGGLGNDISDLPAAGSAPEWISEKAISIGHYFVASGVYTVFGVNLPVSGAPVFPKYLFEEFEKLYGGMWDLEIDPVKHTRKMIAHIDNKRKALGIDKARDRILVDMDSRRELAAG
jgi:hydroxylamine reductase (hybrid-cluster protein)